MSTSGWSVAATLGMAALLGCGSSESNPATGGSGTGNSGATAGSGGSGANGGTGHGGTGTGGHSSGGSGGATPTSLKIAVIGDFGDDSSAEDAVAQMIAGWAPDYVWTAGDNNYPEGAAGTIDDNIGKYYQAFIGNYQGSYGAGSPTNRFFPCPGNHDWYATDLQPYRDYFTLPANERYYDVNFGLVHLISLDCNTDYEPDGCAASSVQGQWAQGVISQSPACWDIVVFHYAAYSSCSTHGSTPEMQWPFEPWGADAVINGHDHVYERLQVGTIPYFVDGFGGAGLYDFGTILPQSQFHYNARHGALLVTATTSELKFEAYNDQGTVIDSYTTNKTCN